MTLPVIKIEAETLPEVWEQAVLSVWENGMRIRTEYDREGDPESRDSTMIMAVKKPWAEPRIHRAFPGGLESLEIYRQEVVEGIHDHWISPEEGKWTYTYHKRLFSYEMEGERINQIDAAAKKMASVPFSRRAQAITWNPKLDRASDDPPCLQRIWFRISEDKTGRKYLNMNSHWRSRDAFKASFMNMYALTDLQRCIAEKISVLRNETVNPGSYVDISDSFHIYGSYYREFEGFKETVQTRGFDKKTWTTEFAEPFFAEARKAIESEKENNR